LSSKSPCGSANDTQGLSASAGQPASTSASTPAGRAPPEPVRPFTARVASVLGPSTATAPMLPATGNLDRQQDKKRGRGFCPVPLLRHAPIDIAGTTSRPGRQPVTDWPIRPFRGVPPYRPSSAERCLGSSRRPCPARQQPGGPASSDEPNADIVLSFQSVANVSPGRGSTLRALATTLARSGLGKGTWRSSFGR
jgi:hypothetical protein